MNILEGQHIDLMQQRTAQEAEIATIDNLALKQRFEAKLTNIETMIREKETEVSKIIKYLQ